MAKQRFCLRKVRSGCTNCKQSHIKCDEKKPRCSRCTRRGKHCSYSGTTKQTRQLIAIAPYLNALQSLEGTEPGSSTASLTIEPFAHTVQPVLKTDLDSSTAPPAPSPSPQKHSPVFDPAEIQEASDFYDSGISIDEDDDYPPRAQQRHRTEMGDLITGLRQGNLHMAPISANSHTILCIGRDFGRHAITIGTQYPDAEVLVVEQLPLDSNARNVHFCEEDMEARWGLVDNSTCFVHLGSVIESFSNRLHIYQEAFRILEPGGWIEIVHVGSDLYKDDVVLENEYSACSQRLRLAGSGRSVDPILNVKVELRRCGFADIRDETDKLPIGTWPEERFLSDIGERAREKMALDMLRNGSRIFQDWNTEEMLKLCLSASGFLEMVDRAYFNVHTFIAQKP